MNSCRQAVMVFVFLFSCVYAQAMMMIYPKYVSFDDNTRIAEMTLINPSDEETINYRIRLNYFEQNHDGSYQEVVQPSGLTGLDLLRHSPKSVTLAPKKNQTVKILKRLPDGTPDGEYTAYIVFTKVLAEKPLEKPKKTASDALEIQLIPIPSFAIPINIAVGARPLPAATLTYLGSSGPKKQPLIRIRLARADTSEPPQSSTIRGDLSVWQSGKMLGFMKGKYLLAGNDYVDVELPLTNVKPGQKAEILFTRYNENDPILTDEVLGSVNTTL